MKINIASILLAAMLLSLELDAAPLSLSKDVRVDVLEAVPTRELWSVAKPDVVESAVVLVDSRSFDPEARPRDGKWYGCAIVMVGTSDLGIKPVTARIWSVRPCELSIRKTMNSKPQLDTEFDMRLDSRELLKLRITKDLVVTINGKLIGRIE